MQPHVLVTAVDHPFVRRGEVPAAALADEGFIIREPGSGTRGALDEYLHAHQMTPRVVMQMSSDEAIKLRLCAAGRGAAVAAHRGPRA